MSVMRYKFPIFMMIVELVLDVNRGYRMNIVEGNIDWLSSYNIIMQEFNSDILFDNKARTAYYEFIK
jgi:hypothetical protein